MKQHKHTLQGSRRWFAIAVVGLLVIASALFLGRNWLAQNYDRLKVERTISGEIEKLEPQLTALGFTDLKQLETSCGYVTYPSHEEMQQDGGFYLSGPGPQYECSSGIDRLTQVPTDEAGKAQFNRNAENLNQSLRANGWKSREDLQTIQWFQEISKGVDWQPDQLNTKTVDDLNCMVDFFTAYSKPAPPAISVQFNCYKPN